MQNSKLKFIIIFLVIFLWFFGVAKISWAATYYINGNSGNDSNPGTILSPWKTINKANKSLVAGDTAYIRGGVSDYPIYYIGALDSSTEGIHPKNSGTGASSRITYSVYPGEKVHFVGNTNDASGIWISNKNWIKVTGYDGSTSARNMKFSNMLTNMWIYDTSTSVYVGPGSNYNEVSYCDFGAINSWAFGMEVYRVSTIFHNSQYNWVHHNTFHDCGGQPPSQYDVCSPLEIGWDDNNNASDNASYNVIENNEFYHGGHNVLGVHAKYNVIRNNVLHNEQWYHATGTGQDNLWYGHATLYTEGTYGNAGYSLYEGNTFSHASFKWGASGIGAYNKLGNSYNVFRYNSLYAQGIAAIVIENHSAATTGHSKYNHIYNNTFFVNGYLACYPNATYKPDTLGICAGGGATGKPAAALPERASIYISGNSPALFVSGGSYYGTVIKNNLFYKNYQANTYAATNMSGFGFGGCSPQTVCGDTVMEHNYTDSSGDPKFTSVGDYGSPSVLNADKEWYWGSSNPDGSDITTIKTQPIFTLQSSSPAIDGGAYLTQANGSGNNSTSLVVADAYYFQPGWGNGAGGDASVAADWIAIGTISNVVQISSINYSTNTITLASPTTWSDNAPIWLYKNSSGQQVLYGSAPDYGAYEYASATPPADTTPPAAPSGVVII